MNTKVYSAPVTEIMEMQTGLIMSGSGDPSSSLAPDLQVITYQQQNSDFCD